MIADEVGCDSYVRELFKGWNNSSGLGLDVEQFADFAGAWCMAKQYLESYDEGVLLGAFCKTSLAKDSVTSKEAPLAQDVELGFRFCMHHIVDLSTVEVREELKRRGAGNGMFAAISTLIKRTMNRSFSVTKGNRIGTGFPQARRRDCRCILFGADTPVILRPDGDHWTFVGDACLASIAKVRFRSSFVLVFLSNHV